MSRDSEGLARSTKTEYRLRQRARIVLLARWSGRAVGCGDVDVQYVWRFLRAQKIDLAGRRKSRSDIDCCHGIVRRCR